MLCGCYSITRGGQYKISENVRLLGLLGLEIVASNVALNLGSYIVSGGMLTYAIIRIRKGQKNIIISGGLFSFFFFSTRFTSLVSRGPQNSTSAVYKRGEWERR